MDAVTAGLAPQTVNKILTTLAAIFTFAERRELITRNPAAVAERCRMNADEIAMDAPKAASEDDADDAVNPEEVLSPEEAGLIAEAPEGFDKTFLLTAVLTGARVGELPGLTWPDVNLTTGRLTIRRSVSWAKLKDQKESKPRFYEPKTTAGKRSIDLAPELLSALKRWELACPKGALNLVFPNLDGTPRHCTTITYGTLRPTLKVAGLRQVTLHSLRHTCASALILSGADTLEVAKFLGHAKPTVTLSVYAHWFNTRRTGRTMATVAGAVFGDRGSSVVAVSPSEARRADVSS